MKNIYHTVEKMLKENKLLRVRDFIQNGIPEYIIYEMVNQGKIIRESRGIYRLSDDTLPKNYDFILISLSIPNAVISTLSALDYYQLTLEIPGEIHITLPRTARYPQITYPPIEVYRMSDDSYQAGIVHLNLEGNKVKIYSVEKTITDCFKFRKRLSKQVALDALKNYFHDRNKVDINLLLKFAHLNRVEKVMRPYLESLL